MSRPSRPRRAHVRRLVSVPLVVALELALVVTAPITVVVGAAVSIATRSTRPVRSVLLVLAYAVIELRALSRVTSGTVDWESLERDVLDQGYRAMRRVLGIRLRLEEGSATTEQLAAADGVIVLARHCGPGDSLFIAWLLAVHHRLTLRIVLKNALRWEPAVDLAGDHLPLCFVGMRRGRARAGVGRLASTLTRGDALLIFPEGGNFTWRRWHEALRTLVAKGDLDEARRARRRTHTLPPRPGGALAALQAAPDADVLLLAHSGFGPDGRDRPWWRLPLDSELVVRSLLLPAAEVPRTTDGARAFLDEAWSRVDTWVAGHADLREATRQAGGSDGDPR